MSATSSSLSSSSGEKAKTKAESVLYRRTASSSSSSSSSSSPLANRNKQKIIKKEITKTEEEEEGEEEVEEEKNLVIAPAMASTSASDYHHANVQFKTRHDNDSDHGGRETIGRGQSTNTGATARFGPLTETLITTLSQDNLFLICFICVELLGAILVILVTCWMSQIGGFGFETGAIVFNFHPVLMTTGMIFLNANGILLYRATPTLRFQQQKLLHFSIQVTMIAVSWIGFAAAFASHTMQNIPHFYSLHSWLGLTALSGVTLSLVTSFLTFLYPKANPIYRRLSLPFHVFGGIANIALSAGICVAGITEKAIFSLNPNPKPEERYPMLPPIGVLLNTFGVIVVIFTILVVWMVTKPEFKRKYKMSVNSPRHMLRREKTYD